MVVSNLVVGAGFSGSTVARLLADRGERVTVVEKKDHIAGNCYDYRDTSGIMIHRYGSHIFHTSDEGVWNFVRRFSEFNSYVHKVRGMIDGTETQIPFNLNSIHDMFPEDVAERLERKLLDMYGYGAKVPILEFQKQDDEDLIHLAQYVYEKVFLHYTMKQWGYSPEEVDGAVTARVPVFVSRDDRYFQDVHQGIPLNGYTEVVKAMLDHPGIEVRTGTSFSDVDIAGYDRIFYSGPLDELLDYRFGQLPYRSVRFDMEEIGSEHYQSNSVVNYPCDHDFTRIHEYKYYLDDRADVTVIAREFSEPFECGKNDRYYPIPKAENMELYQKYLDAAKSEYGNMYVLGRLGDYRYYDMDMAIRRAMSVVDML